MKVTLSPPLKPAFQMAAMATVYRERLLGLCETIEKAKSFRDSWIASSKPPIHHWRTYNTIAFIEATINCSPSERKLIVAEVEFDHE